MKKFQSPLSSPNITSQKCWLSVRKKPRLIHRKFWKLVSCLGMATFPIARLIKTLVEQASEPISEIISQRAKTSPIVKKYIALPPAHLYLWVERQINIRVFGQAPEQTPVYVEKKAVKLGANLLGEAFLLGVGAFILTLEYLRSQRRKMVKEYERGLVVTKMKMQIQNQSIIAEQQEAEIRELRRNVNKLELLALLNEERRE